MNGGPYGSVSSVSLRLRSLWLDFMKWESGKAVQLGFSVRETYLGVEAYVGLASEFEDSDAEDHDLEHSDSDKDYLDMEEEDSDLGEDSDLENVGLESLQAPDLDLEDQESDQQAMQRAVQQCELEGSNKDQQRLQQFEIERSKAKASGLEHQALQDPPLDNSILDHSPLHHSDQKRSDSEDLDNDVSDSDREISDIGRSVSQYGSTEGSGSEVSRPSPAIERSDKLWKLRFQRGQLLVKLDQTSYGFQKLQTSNIGMLQLATVREANNFPSYTGRVIFCLLLESGTEEGTFRRIGLVEVPDLPGFALTPWET